ncbi:MAG TPA: hypothetical protein VJU61_21460, partial [Polyangiaceae bacterium]|nr:hypothetical protein [Polyangiaceae bacterium]
PPIDLAGFDRTGRFLAGRLPPGSNASKQVEWKVWRLDAPGEPIDVAPPGFRHSASMLYWIQ